MIFSLYFCSLSEFFYNIGFYRKIQFILNYKCICGCSKNYLYFPWQQYQMFHKIDLPCGICMIATVIPAIKSLTNSSCHLYFGSHSKIRNRQESSGVFLVRFTRKGRSFFGFWWIPQFSDCRNDDTHELSVHSSKILKKVKSWIWTPTFIIEKVISLS